MQNNTLLIYNAHLVDKNIDIQNGALFVEQGKITGFVEEETLNALLEEGVPSFNAQGCVVLPSFIDMHAHFRDPGLTHKEDIESGCKAASRGGFTTLALMPNTNPVVSSLDIARINNSKACMYGYAHVMQAVSITKDFDGKYISHLDSINSEDVPFISEDGHEVQDSFVMLKAMQKAAEKGLTVSCHCEEPFLAAGAKPFREKALKYIEENNLSSAKEELLRANDLLAMAEDFATERNINLAKKASCHLHICHVSTAHSIEAVRKAKNAGLNVTCEVTPHHLGIKNGNEEPNIFHIVNPPLRSEADRVSLIQALKDGTADVIATDHAPHTEMDKKNASPGFSGLETAFPLCYSVLCKEEGFSLSELSALMSANPAKLLHLNTKGLLSEGYDADLVVIDTESKFTVHGADFASKGHYTPLENKELFGVVKATFLEGRKVFPF